MERHVWGMPFFAFRASVTSAIGPGSVTSVRPKLAAESQPSPPALPSPAAAALAPTIGLYLPTRTKTLRSGASMTATWPDSVGKGLRIQLISVLADSAS